MLLNKKLDLAFTSILVFFVLIIIVFNSLFLNKFFSIQKRNSLYKAYAELSEYIITTEDTDRVFSREIMTIGQNYNVRVLCFDSNGNSSDILGQYPNLSYLRISVNGILLDTKDEYAININENGQDVTFIEDQTNPEKDEQKTIAMVGKVMNKDVVVGYLFIFTTYASITESTKIFNAYIIYLSLIILVVSLIIVYFLSNRLTRPIKEVEMKAKQIANLEFNDKIKVTSHDEIGRLAISINKMSDELEKNINDLKAANEKLREDIKLKEQIHTMREEFISDVSHELKTPISIIGGYSEVLKMPDLSAEEKEEYIDIIIDETVKMNKLVQDLLKYTQIESGFAHIEREDFEITDLINNVIKPFGLIILEKKAKIIIDLESVLVSGDYDLMETVFQNIFNNAINHLDDQKEINIRSERRNKSKLRIYIYNSGEKISKENQKRIWDSFYKIDKARTRDYGGTGLGLSIVKTIMEAHHNEYGVENKENGIEFYFDVDIAKKRDEDNE